MKGKNKNIIKVALFGLFFLIIYIWSTLNTNNIEKKGVYSIVYISNIEGAKSGLKVYFYFYYKGEMYKNSFTGAYKQEEIAHRRFFLKFIPSKPDECIVYTDKPVPSCIKKVPFDGWETIPTKCDD